MTKKKLGCFILAVAIMLCCFALPESNGELSVSATGDVVEISPSELEYEFFEDEGKTTVAIFAYYGTDKKISIPDTIEGYPVTYLEHSSFGDSKTLEYVELPANVEYISPGAFDSSVAITEYAISANNPYYTCVDGVLYNKDKTSLLAYPAGRSGTFTVPRSVVTIGDQAFYKCYLLTSVKMYNNVLSIESHAFDSCWNLETIKLSDNLQVLGYRAFYNCRSLEEIHLPYTLKSISNQALLGGIDSDDNMYYHTTKGIYYVKGSYAESYLKTLHLPTQYIKAETRTITDIDSNVTLYDSADVFPKTGKLDLAVTIKPNSSYTALLPVRYSDMASYYIAFTKDGTATALSSPCVIRFNAFPSETIPTATKVYLLTSGTLVEKTRAPQAAFVGTTFSSADTFVVITNNDFSLKGDIDGDGTRSIYDARIALALSANLVSGLTSAQLTTANVDGTTGVTTSDAYEILCYAAGIKQ